MRKFIYTAALLMGVATTAQAGGFLTNTNQSVTFLRNPARDAAINVDGAYFNPAGIGFLNNGWHLGFHLQSAYQTRKATANFAPFGMGTVNGVANPADGIKQYKGKATAPVIPSLDLARVGDKWFASFHFSIIGGGGKCKFDESLGSFESQVAMIPQLIEVLAPGAVSGYTMDSRMQGRQYYFGGQFGVGYKVTPNLNVSVGGRVVYADCNYYGYVRNIGLKVNTPQGAIQMPAGQFFESQNMPHFAGLVADRELNCDQTGWGFTPIIGVDYKLGKWNLAAKYEFKTRMRLKNRTGENTSGLEEYDDGKKIAADLPAILTLGAQYELLKNVRLLGGFHYYFDKQATQHKNREEHLNGGSWEVLAGMEYDINKRWTVSAGWQTTHYGLGDDSKYITDMSFVTNSNSVGIGARFQLRKKVALNIAYFKTFYKHYKKDFEDYGGVKEKFGSMLQPMTQQLTAGAAKLNAVIANPQATEEMKAAAKQQLGVINHELGAIGKIAGGMAGFSTQGSDTYHRTNDVFGLSLEIDF